ncbi:hypothetical protein LOAG_14018 [Loa loa]|uniref:PDZ domain-containing protein n=1 Tax=Loa loa TaxID=7209 RepID=A0A1S0TIH4_LOALO|nr:hypothetical protein LOAG_14018 [Loa loa]EFO14500.1 hypothetical protein LOAG_14018 [Loa loa]
MISSSFSSKQSLNQQLYHSQYSTSSIYCTNNAQSLINDNSIPITSFFNNVQHITVTGYIIFIGIIRSKQQIILFGSPANKAGLQVGDRIIEVNGYPTEGKSHAYIVKLIHQLNSSLNRSIRYDIID